VPKRTISQDEARELLHRAGYPPDVIEAVGAELPDPIDLDAAEPVLASHGITREHLVESLGGSP
jgi:hypothetical protein